MKSTQFNVTTGGNWFITNIYRAPSYLATIPAFILKALRVNEDLQTAVFVDRDPLDIDSKGQVILGGQGFVDTSVASNAVTIVEFVGERDPDTREITFGVGAITPTNVKNALAGAVAGLNVNAQIDASWSGKAGFVDAVKLALSPSLAKTSVREALNIAFDLVPIARGEVEDSKIVVQFDQGANTGSIKLVSVPTAELPNFVASGATFVAEVTPPETEAQGAASVKNFGE